jgi:hypothetical protein
MKVDWWREWNEISTRRPWLRKNDIPLDEAISTAVKMLFSSQLLRRDREAMEIKIGRGRPKEISNAIPFL